MSKFRGTYGEIWRIAYPLIIGNIAHTLIAVADTAFMGRVGQTEQATIGYISMFYVIMFMIGYAYTKGTQILIARKEGEGNSEQVGVIVDNALYILSALALVIFVIVLLFSVQLLDIFIKSESVLAASCDFLDYRIYGLFFTFSGSVFLAYYSGIGRTLILPYAVGIMAALNIGLNYVLIFGKLGFPEMGIAGAGLASTISEAVALIIMLVWIFYRKLHRKHGLFKCKKLNLPIISVMSDLSLPLVAQHLIGLGAWFVFFTLIEKMGEKELAISNVVKMIYMFFSIPTYGLATSTNTVISNIVGQRWTKGVYPALNRILIVSLIFSVASAIIIFIFPELLLKVFSEDSLLIQDSIMPLYVAGIAILIYSAATVVFNCIVSIGSTKVSLIIETCGIFFYLLFVLWAFKIAHASLTVVWMSEWFYWILIALFSIAFLKSSNWQKKFQIETR